MDSKMDSKRIERVVERSEVIDTLITFTRAVDRRDWERCRELMADHVIDAHGTPETLAELEVWFDRILDASSIDDVFGSSAAPERLMSLAARWVGTSASLP
jgi:hypothetical protein